MKNNKNLKLIMMAFMVSFSIVLGILLVDRLEKNNSIILYDFENDKIRDYPEGFVGNMRNISDTHIIYFDDIHKNVVNISYLTIRPINIIQNDGVEFNTLFKPTKRGIVEFDVYGLFYKRINIDICQTDEVYDYRDDIAIRMPRSSSDRYINILDDEGQLEEVLSFRKERWYNFKIEFDVEKGWKLWINDNLIQSNEYLYLFNKPPPYFCQLYFATYELGNIFYVDNVKFILNLKG